MGEKKEELETKCGRQYREYQKCLSVSRFGFSLDFRETCEILIMSFCGCCGIAFIDCDQRCRRITGVTGGSTERRTIRWMGRDQINNVSYNFFFLSCFPSRQSALPNNPNKDAAMTVRKIYGHEQYETCQENEAKSSEDSYIQLL